VQSGCATAARDAVLAAGQPRYAVLECPRERTEGKDIARENLLDELSLARGSRAVRAECAGSRPFQ
jgi:hypothetical protein